MPSAIFHSLASAIALSLVATASLASITAQAADEVNITTWVGEYEDMIQPLLAIVVVLTSFILVLFAHMAPYAFLKSYTAPGQSVEGQTLSCYELGPNRFNVAVLYRYKGTRFMRGVTLARAKNQGETVEILVRASNPHLGLPRDTVDAELAKHSHLKTLLISIPGVLATAITILNADRQAQEMQNVQFANIIVIGTCVLCYSLGVTIGGIRWEGEKQRRFSEVWSHGFGSNLKRNGLAGDVV